MAAAVRSSAFSAFNASLCWVKLAVLHGRGAKTDTWRASSAELPCCGPPARDTSAERRGFRGIDLDLGLGLDLSLGLELNLGLGLC